MNVLDLPTELLQAITQHLGLRDYFCFHRTCNRLYQKRIPLQFKVEREKMMEFVANAPLSVLEAYRFQKDDFKYIEIEEDEWGFEKKHKIDQTFIILAFHRGIMSLCRDFIAQRLAIRKRYHLFKLQIRLFPDLVEYGYKCNEPFAEWTPMHIAAFKGRYDVVDLMLQCGSSPNALDSLDHTPLLHSAYSGHLSVCQLLIDAGADVNHRVRGRTALKAAAEQGHADVCVLLIENGADPDLFMDWYQLGRSRSFESVLESMLEHGADLQDKIEGRTLLHYAARAQSYLMCEYLLMKGVDGNAQDNNGRTPLFEAFKFDIKDKSEFLELHKDSINKQLDSGLIVPVIETRMACLDFCELFARYGFDSNHKDNNGISLVEILEAATLDLDFGGDPILGILPKHVIVKRVGLESTFQWFTH